MALLEDISEYRAVLPIGKNAGGDRLPDSDAAEIDYLVPILGDKLYTSLVNAYDDETLTAAQDKLLTYCQKVVAPFAWVHNLPLSQIELDTNGLHVLESGHVRSPYKFEYNNAVDELTRRGYAAQEHLILFLKQHIDDYPDWLESSYNDPQGFMLIRSGEDMASVHTLLQPHRCYSLLRGVLLTDVSEFLLNYLGEDYYYDLNARIISDTLTEDEKKIIGKLRAAATTRAMYHAAQVLNIKFAFGGGFTIAKETKEIAGEARQAAYQQQVNAFQQSMEQYSDKHIGNAIKYMNSNASSTVFPLFYSSDKYQDPATKHSLIDNDGKKILRF